MRNLIFAFLLFSISASADICNFCGNNTSSGGGGGTGTITGTGTNQQVTVWNGPSSITGFTNFIFPGTGLIVGPAAHEYLTSVVPIDGINLFNAASNNVLDPPAYMAAYAGNTVGTTGAYFMSRSRGTFSAPTPLALNDNLGEMIWLAEDNGDSQGTIVSAIKAYASENHVDGGNHGSGMQFFITPNGSEGTGSNNMQLDGTGLTLQGLPLNLNGSSSGTISIVAQAAAGTYNFNLPTTAGTAGQVLTSQGGGSSAMTWTSGGGGGGVTTVGAFSGSSQINGANISGSTITFGPADTSNPGMVSTGTQTLAGAKTFTGNTNIAAGTASVGTIGQVGSTAIHPVNGGRQVTIRTITSDLIVDTTTTDYLIYVNTTSAIIITMPGITAGRQFIVKDISGNPNITMNRHASETIEGAAANYQQLAPYSAILWGSDGTNWWKN